MAARKATGLLKLAINLSQCLLMQKNHEINTHVKNGAENETSVCLQSVNTSVHRRTRDRNRNILL